MTDPSTIMNSTGEGYLPGLLELKFTSFGEGWVEAEVAVRKALMALWPRG